MNRSATRALAFDKVAAKAGVKAETQLWTAGACDGVLILRGEEKNIHRCLNQLVAVGNVRTETLRAIEGREFQSLLRGGSTA